MTFPTSRIRLEPVEKFIECLKVLKNNTKIKLKKPLSEENLSTYWDRKDLAYKL